MNDTWTRRVEAAVVGLLFLTGMWFLFGQLVLGNFSVVPGDLGDSRFNALVLEHGYRHLLRDAWHGAFWSPNWSFFPHKNVLAYSDNMIGTLPLYALARILGLRELSAFNAWVIAVSVANFAAMYLFMRELTLSRIGAALGGFLFAFSMPRGEQLNHLQLFPQFFTPLCFFCLVRLKAMRPWAIWGAFACVVLQIYAGVYIGWFLALALGILVFTFSGIAAFNPKLRRMIWTNCTQQWPHWVGASVLAIAAVIPAGIHYLRAQAEVGPRHLNEIQGMLPRLASYGLPADYTYLYSPMLKLKQGLPVAHEHVMFAGYIALACSIALVVNLLLKVPAPELDGWLRALMLIWLFTVIATFWNNGSLWNSLYRLIPGGGAIRAVSRITLLQLLPLGAGVAWAATRIQNRAGLAVTIVFAGLVILENSGVAGYNFSTKEHEARIERIRSELKQAPCDVFFVSGTEDAYKTQLDAMWASLESKIPTINGYSGNAPSAWPFESARDARGAQLRSWLSRHHRQDHLCSFRH